MLTEIRSKLIERKTENRMSRSKMREGTKKTEKKETIHGDQIMYKQSHSLEMVFRDCETIAKREGKTFFLKKKNRNHVVRLKRSISQIDRIECGDL